jgi:hypothetical protein
MTRPYTQAAPAPLLYVTLRQEPKPILERFGSATAVGKTPFPALAPARTAHFYLLAEPRP